MRRYSLRTLIIATLILPPLGAWAWHRYRAYVQDSIELLIYCDIQANGPQPQVMVETGNGPPEEWKGDNPDLAAIEEARAHRD